MNAKTERAMLDPQLVRGAIRDALRMLDPRTMARNPVMFVTEVGALLTTLSALLALGSGDAAFPLAVALVLWLTVVFGNFAEALAEARGKAQTQSLRATRSTTLAQRRRDDDTLEQVPSTALQRGDHIVVVAGELIASDGEIIEGVASIDESAITGESAPVVREAGGDRSGVTGGTRVLSDRIVVRVSASAGETFLDRMIALVEGAQRRKTPNELALTVTLAGLTLAFLLVTVSLLPIAGAFGITIDIPTAAALLVCLIPTTIGALLAAIGLAGMDRALAANVLAKSGKAVELAGDIDTVLLDKTGTITRGNRMATRLHAGELVETRELASASLLASLADTTPEGRSIVALAEAIVGERLALPADATVVHFSAHTRLSGVDLPGGVSIRKGAVDAMTKWLSGAGGDASGAAKLVETIAREGATPLVVAVQRPDAAPRWLGVIELSDVLKPGIAQRLARLRAMGLRVVMVTGDNPLTAAAIAAKAGVDDFLAEATPEDKLAYIRADQAKGRRVAMMGDGTNDAPALAQADIGVAMNSGTQAAKEAANMVDLDSDPTKLIEVVEIGKQLLMTRGALTAFSIANDLAKYFAIVPALFVGQLPALAALDLMQLGSPRSAIASALIFNALIIPLLIPIALRGVRYQAIGAEALLRRNLAIYGLGGVIVPFLGIKLIDLALALLGLP